MGQNREYLQEKPVGKKKRRSISRQQLSINFMMSFATALFNILVVLLVYRVTKYSTVSKLMFILGNGLVLLFLLIFDLLIFLSIRTRKPRILIACLIVLTFLVPTTEYAWMLVSRVNNSIEQIVETESEESISASFIIYTESVGSPIIQIDDLSGKKVGVLSGTHMAEVAQKRLENEGITATIVNYTNSIEEFTALINGEIDAAVLPPTYATTIGEDENLKTFVDKTKSILNFSDTVTTSAQEGSNKDLTKDPFTVLLTGENEGLADTIILMSVNPVSMKITMTSIARDSYVPITCNGYGKSKINAAHYTSEGCMVDTVENLTGVHIDYTVEFNFASVIQIVDAVGGVDVDITESFDAQSWDIESDSLVVYHIEAGDNQHLNGQLALGYARERHAFADGDFARQRHQQEIIYKVIAKIMALKDPNMAVSVLEAAGENVKTNISVEQLLNFVTYIMAKSQRYYDGSNLSGVLNIQSSRIFGYDSSVWNEGLQMNLYTYEIYKGSVIAEANNIERNTNLNSPYSIPDSVNWDATQDYPVPPVSKDYVYEYKDRS
ncbi:LCP family protein [Solobacterium moorei]|uniref:LCP family protein n=1 Tax=Solobacterium moorei TaxID=102148 RepID=UPI0028D26B58|nr:LCP family protein [Solobacterium moorei]